MSIFDAVLIGALGCAAMLLVVVAVIVAVWKVWPMLTSLEASLSGLQAELKASSALIGSVHGELAKIRGELTYMRQITAPPGQLQNLEPSGGEAQPGAPSVPKGPTPFPSPPMDLFEVAKEVPDATIEDTDKEGLTQTDADLVEIEKLEALRQMGIEVEDSDTVHPGVEVESE